jgi:hypothetical protein
MGQRDPKLAVDVDVQQLCPLEHPQQEIDAIVCNLRRLYKQLLFSLRYSIFGWAVLPKFRNRLIILKRTSGISVIGCSNGI